MVQLNNQWRDRRMDKASDRIACPRLKITDWQRQNISKNDIVQKQQQQSIKFVPSLISRHVTSRHVMSFHIILILVISYRVLSFDRWPSFEYPDDFDCAVAVYFLVVTKRQEEAAFWLLASSQDELQRFHDGHQTPFVIQSTSTPNRVLRHFTWNQMKNTVRVTNLTLSRPFNLSLQRSLDGIFITSIKYLNHVIWI